MNSRDLQDLASLHSGGARPASDSDHEGRGRLPVHRGWPPADRRDFFLVGEYPRPRASGDRSGIAAQAAKSITSCWRDSRTMRSKSCAAACEESCRRGSAHIFFSDDGSTAVEVALKIGGAVLAECGATGEEGDRCARSRLSRRYGRGDVGRRGVFIHRPVSRAAVSRASRAFRLLLSMPRGENARDVRHRLRGSVGAAARRKARRDCGGDRRAAACRAQAG